jgi:lactoylglutathione lyase
MRLLHTMLRVGDLERSITFYTQLLNMKELRRKEYPDGQFTLAFVGYGDESNTTLLELTYNWDKNSYDLGNAFGHIAIEVDDIYRTVEALKTKNVVVSREPAPMKFGINSPVIAFIKDPDGYTIELIQKKT